MTKIRIPIKLPSPNKKVHWATTHKFNKTARLLIRAKWINDKPPCLIRLTRIAPRPLDSHDNLQTAFKGITDIVADLLIPGLAPGQADSSESLQWVYDQRKGAPKEYAIEISIEPFIPLPLSF